MHPKRFYQTKSRHSMEKKKSCKKSIYEKKLNMFYKTHRDSWKKYIPSWVATYNSVLIELYSVKLQCGSMTNFG